MDTCLRHGVTAPSQQIPNCTWALQFSIYGVGDCPGPSSGYCNVCVEADADTGIDARACIHEDRMSHEAPLAQPKRVRVGGNSFATCERMSGTLYCDYCAEPSLNTAESRPIAKRALTKRPQWSRPFSWPSISGAQTPPSVTWAASASS